MTAVSVANDHSIAVGECGGAYTWGANAHGQLGLAAADPAPVRGGWGDAGGGSAG